MSNQLSSFVCRLVLQHFSGLFSDWLCGVFEDCRTLPGTPFCLSACLHFLFFQRRTEVLVHQRWESVLVTCLGFLIIKRLCANKGSRCTAVCYSAVCKYLDSDAFSFVLVLNSSIFELDTRIKGVFQVFKTVFNLKCRQCRRPKTVTFLALFTKYRWKYQQLA